MGGGGWWRPDNMFLKGGGGWWRVVASGGGWWRVVESFIRCRLFWTFLSTLGHVLAKFRTIKECEYHFGPSWCLAVPIVCSFEDDALMN